MCIAPQSIGFDPEPKHPLLKMRRRGAQREEGLKALRRIWRQIKVLANRAVRSASPIINAARVFLMCLLCYTTMQWSSHPTAALFEPICRRNPL
jgi:hypothetical protein